MLKKWTCGLFAIILIVSGCTHHKDLEPLSLVSQQDLSVEKRQEEIANMTAEELTQLVDGQEAPARGEV